MFPVLTVADSVAVVGSEDAVEDAAVTVVEDPSAGEAVAILPIELASVI